MQDERGMGGGFSPVTSQPIPPSNSTQLLYWGNVNIPIGEKPMSTITQSEIARKPCEMCRKIPNHTLHSHHIIPRYMESYNDLDVVQVCKSCHKKADRIFEKFILYPYGKNWMSELWNYKGQQNIGRVFKTLCFFEGLMLDPHGQTRGLDKWHDRVKFLILRNKHNKHLKHKLLFSFKPQHDVSYMEKVAHNDETETVSHIISYTKYTQHKYPHWSKALFNFSPEEYIGVHVELHSVNNRPFRILSGWRKRRPIKTP